MLMTKWIATLAAAGIVALAPSSATPAAAASQAVARPPSAQTTDFGARRQSRHVDVRRTQPYEPRYYARPYYYRPYPYRVPYPFVLGYGPWWW
jgi:hypothetical protein